MNPESDTTDLIVPQWPAPARVRAGTFTRAVTQNLDTALLAETFDLDSRQLFLPSLEQVHGRHAVETLRDMSVEQADACFSRERGGVAMIRTADCLPLLVCDRAGSEVAAIHAGWRGLVAGVIESGLGCLRSAPDQLLVWLGPAISQAHFEVGPEVREAFLDAAAAADQQDTGACFVAHGEKYMADLYQLARLRLRGCGVEAVYGGGMCTYADARRFHSYRRDGSAAGRIYSFILLA